MYHYTECGLDNVWLENGYTVRQTPYGRGVSIDDADGLHQVLVAEVVKKIGRMTGKELRFLRTHLSLSQENLAKCLGATDQSVSLWERTGKVPATSDALVRLLVIERMRGNEKVTLILNRINDVDRLVNQKIVAKETRNKWRSEVAMQNDERFALAA
ncbi:MAG: transcriptional regulator [Burkholderiales bacterium]|nr:transcriptional regulator [Burkholderiales bacterium]